MVNKYVAADWVKKVILSCETIPQLKSSEKLIFNFNALFEDWFLLNYLFNISISQENKIRSNNKTK